MEAIDLKSVFRIWTCLYMMYSDPDKKGILLNTNQCFGSGSVFAAFGFGQSESDPDLYPILGKQSCFLEILDPLLLNTVFVKQIVLVK